MLAGMACNILFGAVATLLVLLNGEAVRGLFVWGAGDLTQSGWTEAGHLGLQVLAGVGELLPCLRALAPQRLGDEGAAGRGLAVWPAFPAACGVALWLASSAIASVEVIGFVGLLAPNLARLLGLRRAGAELAGAALLGAGSLALADGPALAAGTVSRDLVPTGAVAALIGAPMLILMTLGTARAADHPRFASRAGRRRAGPWLLPALGLLGAAAAVLARWLDLVGLGDAFAAGRGLAIERAPIVLLALAGMIAALVTAFLGPVAFVGLIAPHMASLLGACRGPEQLAAAGLIGIVLFVAADWLGRTALYPKQLPAGAVASVLGGASLVAFPAVRRG